MAQELRPDVIVLDMRLPDGDGSDVVAEFRRRGTLAQTPLVVYSAAEIDAARATMSSELGTTVFLNKGRASPEELRDQVLGLVGAVTSASDGHMHQREEESDGTDPDVRTAESARHLRPRLSRSGSTSRSAPAPARAARSLSAFDHALQQAGVADFNLVTLSSVIPPGSRIRTRRAARCPVATATCLFCVRAEAFAEHSGDIAWAGLGWCVDETGGGLFVEHHGGSEAVGRGADRAQPRRHERQARRRLRARPDRPGLGAVHRAARLRAGRRGLPRLHVARRRRRTAASAAPRRATGRQRRPGPPRRRPPVTAPSRTWPRRHEVTERARSHRTTSRRQLGRTRSSRTSG